MGARERIIKGHVQLEQMIAKRFHLSYMVSIRNQTFTHKYMKKENGAP